MHFDQSEGMSSFHNLERAHTYGFFYAFGFLGATLIPVSSVSLWSLLLVAALVSLLVVIQTKEVDSG